jgi:hypothetical protein
VDDGDTTWLINRAQGPIVCERRGKSWALIQCSSIHRRSLRMCLNHARMRKRTHDEGGKSKATPQI